VQQRSAEYRARMSVLQFRPLRKAFRYLLLAAKRYG